MKAVLFDLDGTLLFMDEQEFVKGYFSLLVKKLEKFNLNSEKLIADVWKGTKAMYVNNGIKTNEQVFWECFKQQGYSDEVCNSIQDFYDNEFAQSKKFCQYNKLAKRVVEYAKKNFEKVILATNPIFPKRATLERMGWVNLLESDFDYISYYENSTFAKPNQKYYMEILNKFNLEPQDCIMIGNNDKEDYLAASSVGIETIIVENCRIKKEDIKVSTLCKFEELETVLAKYIK